MDEKQEIEIERGKLSVAVLKQMNNRSRLLLDAARFVEMIQTRQGITISAPEEIAFINGFVDREKLMESAKAYGKSPYGEHLKAVAEGKVRY